MTYTLSRPGVRESVLSARPFEAQKVSLSYRHMHTFWHIGMCQEYSTITGMFLPQGLYMSCLLCLECPSVDDLACLVTLQVLAQVSSSPLNYPTPCLLSLLIFLHSILPSLTLDIFLIYLWFISFMRQVTLLCFLLYLQCPEQCLVYNKYLLTEWMSFTWPYELTVSLNVIIILWEGESQFYFLLSS